MNEYNFPRFSVFSLLIFFFFPIDLEKAGSIYRDSPGKKQMALKYLQRCELGVGHQGSGRGPSLPLGPKGGISRLQRGWLTPWGTRTVARASGLLSPLIT